MKGVEGQKGVHKLKCDGKVPIDKHGSHLRNDFYDVCLCVPDFRLTKKKKKKKI